MLPLFSVLRHDPGALVFGQRFLSHDAPAPVVAAAGRHFDVISVQPSLFSPGAPEYVVQSVATLVNISRMAGRPVMVADQSTHFVEPAVAGGTPPLQPNGCDPLYRQGCAPSASEAGVLYGQFLDGIRAAPEVVGYAHCQYINRAVGGADNLRLKQGLLDFDGSSSAHQAYVDAVARANRRAHTGPARH